jgi:glutamate decarboxylase
VIIVRLNGYIIFNQLPSGKNVLQITPVLKGKMMEVGTLMVGYQPLNEIPNFFRNIISSAAVTKADVDFLLSELDRLGQDL